MACIPTLAVAVLPYNTMVCYSKLKSKYFHHCWETWHYLTSSQLPSGLPAGPMLKWRGHRMRIGNRNKTSEWISLIFQTLEYLLISECRPDHTPKNQLPLCQQTSFNEWAQSAYLLVPIDDDIFSNVLCIVHILHFFTNLGIGGPLNVGGPWL